jgi:hypothetical protein
MSNAMVGALFATLGLDTALFQKGLDDSKSAAGGFAKSTGGIGNMLKTGLAAGFVAAGAAAVAAGGYFIKSGMDALQSADDIGDAALRIGSTAEEYQKLTIAASKFGAEPEVVTGAIDKMNVSLGTFVQTGGGPARNALEQLGLASKVASGEIGNGTEAMYDIVDALAGVSSASERAAIANQIFGRSAGGTILELVGQGAAMREAGEEAQRSGRVMSNEMVAKLGAANNTIRDTKLAFSQMAQVLAGEVIISSMGFIDNLGPMIEQGKALAGQIAEFLGPSFRELAATISSLMSGPFGQVLVETLKLIAQVVGTVVVVALRSMIEVLNVLFGAIDTVARGAGSFVSAFTRGFQLLAATVPGFIQRMVEGVTGWLQGRLFQVLKGVIDRVKAVSDAFFRLYDAVVGNSYVPDMVEEIADWMGPRLQEAMVNPALEATAETGAAFSSMAGEIDTHITDIFKSITSKDWGGALGGIFSVLGGQSGNLGKIGKIGSAVMGAFGGKIPGFKTGGSFRVGGSGGPDSQLMAFRASPGEMVDIRRPGQQLAGSGAGMHFDLRGAVMTSDLLAQMNQMASQQGQSAFNGARSAVPADMAKSSRYRRGR